jgi:carbamoyl-phosphate synthase large subunit
MTAARCCRRVLVTGVGGAPGFDLAASIVRRGVQVVGVDADPLAAGLHIPGIIPRLMPPAEGPGYPAALLELCLELKPDALFSAVEHELPYLVGMQDRLRTLGVRTWLPPLSAVEACIDKAAFHAMLTEHGLPVPRTFLPAQLGEIPDQVPLVVKPRRGQGSKDVYFCSAPAQARVVCELVTDPVIQERVHGREFTADCVTDRGGHASVILRHRLVVKGGLAMVSQTFNDDQAAQLVRDALAVLGMTGPCCVQGMIIGAPQPQVWLLEANARFAGAFRASEEAGADLVGQALNGIAGLPVDHGKLTYQPGIRVTKYVETLAAGRPDSAHHRGVVSREGAAAC